MKTRIALISLTLLMLAGCAAPKNSPPPRKPVTDKRITVDEALRHSVSVMGLSPATSGGGFLSIQVDLQNTTRSEQAIVCEVEWLDDYRLPINLPVPSTTSMTLQGLERSAMVIAAPTPRAKDFRLKIHQP